MQIDVRECVFAIGDPRLNSADEDRPFVTVPFGGADLRVMEEHEANQLIALGCQIKDMFRQHAEAAVWAVSCSQDGEVAGPMTRGQARQFIRDNAQSFIGALTIVPATLDLPGADLDAQLSPPAIPGRDTDRPPTGYRAPALDKPGRCDSAWTTGAAHGPCVGERHDRGQCMDATGYKFPYRAPAGTDA